jgi:hypothetical protein
MAGFVAQTPSAAAGTGSGASMAFALSQLSRISPKDGERQKMQGEE